MKKNFKPNQAYIDEAVEQYLNYGGKIEVVELDDESFQTFMNLPPDPVDEYLANYE